MCDSVVSDDVALCRRCAAGDRDAWIEFVDLHQEPMLGFAKRWTGSQPDADDLVQDTFLYFFNHLKSEIPRRPRVYLWLKLRCNCTDWHRKHSRAGVMQSLHDGPDGGQIDVESDDPGPPDKMMMQNEQAEQIREALEQLREDCRAVLLLRYYDGLSPPEIAERLVLPVTTVHSRLHTALQKVRELLPPQDE